MLASGRSSVPGDKPDSQSGDLTSRDWGVGPLKEGQCVAHTRIRNPGQASAWGFNSSTFRVTKVRVRVPSGDCLALYGFGFSVAQWQSIV